MNMVIKAISELLDKYCDDSIIDANKEISKGIDRKTWIYMFQIDKKELSKFNFYKDLPCELSEIVDIRYSNRKCLRNNLEFFKADSAFPYRCSFSQIPISKNTFFEKKGIIVANVTTGFCKTNDYGNYRNKYAIDELWLLEDMSFIRTQFLEDVGSSSSHYFPSDNNIGLKWKRNVFTCLSEIEVYNFLPEGYDYDQYIEYLKEDNYVGNVEIYIDHILCGVYGDSIFDEFKY